MDGVHAAALGQINDAGDVQIGAQRALVLADQVGLIRLGAEEGVSIFVGVHGHRVQTQVVAGPEDTNGDLAAVGGQNFFEGAYCHKFSPFLKYSKNSNHCDRYPRGAVESTMLYYTFEKYFCKHYFQN